MNTNAPVEKLNQGIYTRYSYEHSYDDAGNRTGLAISGTWPAAHNRGPHSTPVVWGESFGYTYNEMGHLALNFIGSNPRMGLPKTCRTYGTFHMCESGTLPILSKTGIIACERKHPGNDRNAITGCHTNLTKLPCGTQSPFTLATCAKKD